MSNLVLYRRFRPLKFAEVINQEHVKLTLINSVKNNRMGHAYLFTGPRGVGKTTLARIFARAVNCQNLRDGEPCNLCPVCQEFLAGSALDILEIDAASHTGVDNVRELIEHLQFAPARAKYKVIIIDEVHMLSKGAFNALLKTLEEPPKHAIFILATTEIHKVPATIISRTQRFDFKKVASSEIMKLLSSVLRDLKVTAEDGALLLIADAADGSFRDSLSLLDQVLNYQEEGITQELVERILGLTGVKVLHQFMQFLIDRQTVEAVNFISRLVYGGRDLFQFQKDFLEYLRKLILLNLGAQTSLGYDKDINEMISRQALSVSLLELIKITEIFRQAGSELKWSSVPSLNLEIAAAQAVFFRDAGQTGQKQGENAKIEPMVAQTQAEQSEPPTQAEPPVLRAEMQNNPTDLLALVKSRWNEVLEKIKDYNHSLLSSLKLADPLEVKGNELILVFPYKFHKDTIDARKNRVVVDQVLEDVLGVKLMVKPVLNKDLEKSDNGAGDDLVESALKVFGGKIEE